MRAKVVRAGSGRDDLPPVLRAHPCLGQDFGRLLARALVDLRPAGATARSRLDLPRRAIGADVDVATPPRGAVAVPPVMLDSHRLTVQHQVRVAVVTILDIEAAQSWNQTTIGSPTVWLTTTMAMVATPSTA